MEFLNGLDAIAVASLVFLVVGFVELVKRAYAKDWFAVTVIIGSAVVGAVFAPQAGDITWFQGLLVGLSASGVVTTFKS